MNRRAVLRMSAGTKDTLVMFAGIVEALVQHRASGCSEMSLETLRLGCRQCRDALGRCDASWSVAVGSPQVLTQ